MRAEKNAMSISFHTRAENGLLRVTASGCDDSKVARIAIVCHPACATAGFVWETVAIGEGLCVRFFQSLDDASAWLETRTSPGF